MRDDGSDGWTLDTLKAYFEAILREMRIALDTASVEREKAAQVVREALARQIDAGDANLRQHVTDQVRQLEALVSANERQTQAAFAASAEAIRKAEVATEKRFDSVNEFRAQLADQATRFMPREVAEARIDDLAKKLDELAERSNTAQGRSAGVAAMIAGGVALIVAVVTVANYLSSH